MLALLHLLWVMMTRSGLLLELGFLPEREYYFTGELPTQPHYFFSKNVQFASAKC